MTSPSSAVADSAISTARAKLPVQAPSVAAKYAPIMYRDPCARLMKFMMPHTSVSPAAMRNSITPSWVALSACSSTTPPLIALPERCACGGSILHGALGGISITVVGQDLVAKAELRLAVRILDDRRHVVLHDREVVRPQLEGAAHRTEIGLLQLLDECFLVFDSALDPAHASIEEHDGVVVDGRIFRRRAIVLFHEARDELLVRFIRQVFTPEHGAHEAIRFIPERRKRVVVDCEDAIQRNLVLQSRLGILLHELDAEASGIKDEYGVGVRVAQLSELGREIHLCKRGKRFADDVTLEIALEACGHLTAGLV